MCIQSSEYTCVAVKTVGKNNAPSFFVLILKIEANLHSTCLHSFSPLFHHAQIESYILEHCTRAINIGKTFFSDSLSSVISNQLLLLPESVLLV